MTISKTSYPFRFGFLLLILFLVFILNMSLGSVDIPFQETLKSLFFGKTGNTSWEYIIWNYRFPKALTAVVVGGGLAVSGLLMQTFFRNPLAGPFVLGISSGASLGAALLLMGFSFFGGWFSLAYISDISLAIASSLGSLLVLLVVMSVASRIKDAMALLIIGLMFGSMTAALVSVLSYFSNAEQLQQYIFWSFGSVGNLSFTQVGILAVVVVLGLFFGILSIKPLNSLLLGEKYARSMGVNIRTARIQIILASGLLAGGITAFAGPIAFIGLAVPHLTRQIVPTSEHRIMLPAVFIYGSILLLVCDTVAQLPGTSHVLPLNAITSLVGAPVVIWLLVRKRRFVF